MKKGFMKTMTKTREWILYTGCGLLIAALSFALFYRTAMADVGDLIFHARTADSLGLLRSISVGEYISTVEFSHILGYPAWHFVCKVMIELLSAVAHPETEEAVQQILAIAASMANTFFLLITFGLYIAVFRHFFQGTHKNLLAAAGACAMVFAGPLYCKLINPAYYWGQDSVAIWHNPTYLAVEPLALLCFFLYLKMAEEKRTDWRQFVMFGTLLLISGLFKPSFYQMFIPALVIFCVVNTLYTRWEAFRFSLCTAFSVVPSGLLALVQMNILSDADAKIDEANGMAVGLFKVLGYYSPHPLLSTVLTLGFPLVMLVICRKELLKNKMLLLAGCAVLSGFLQYALLYKEVNTYAGDFGWGYSLSLVLIFTACLIRLNQRFHNGERRGPLYVGLTVFGLHVFFGLLYYKEILLHMNLYGPLL